MKDEIAALKEKSSLELTRAESELQEQRVAK